MTRKIENLYAPADLSAYSFKQRIMIRLADWMFFILISLIGKTLRFETEGWEHFEKIYADGKIPIYVFWHNRIFAGTYFFRRRKIVVITSRSFDGEYIARFIRRFGYGAARGSSTRGGVSALIELIRAMRAELPVAFSIDGPRGPKYAAKSGACLLSKKTGNPLMPFVVETKKFWELGSWDNLQIPKPLSRVRVFIGAPIYVSSGGGENEIENKRLELQKTLDELVARGKQWRESKS
ncbi:MAG: lysophospholipid acyltransferase family protein [Pyrinomonadaceae bacterium]